jgi:hypothetical protein
MTHSRIHLLIIFPLFAALLSGSCAKARPILDDIKSSAKRTGEKVRPILDDIKSSMKRTGEQAISPLDQTRKQYSCAQDDTQFYVEKSEISSGQVSPGDEIKHVLQYALCAPAESVTVQGMLTRKIKFNDKEVRVSKDSYAQIYKAGTWAIIAYIEVPDSAPNGSYILETIILFGKRTIKRSNIFIVRKIGR